MNKLFINVIIAGVLLTTAVSAAPAKYVQCFFGGKSNSAALDINWPKDVRFEGNTIIILLNDDKEYQVPVSACFIRWK